MKRFSCTGDYFSGRIVFATERLLLRKIESGDADDMFDYSSRENTCKHLLWSAHPSPSYTRNLVEKLKRDYKSGTYYELAIIWCESGKMIGTCGLTSVDEKNRSAEIGYVLSPDYWGRGIAAEAASVLINFAFSELEFNRVEAKYMRENESSRRVMEKCGMTFEGIARGRLFVKGKYRDIGTCAITADEYFVSERENLYEKYNKTGFLGRLYARIK